MDPFYPYATNVTDNTWQAKYNKNFYACRSGRKLYRFYLYSQHLCTDVQWL